VAVSGVFVFLMRPSGVPITEEIWRRFDTGAARNELPPLRWVSEDTYAVGLGPDVTGLHSGPALSRTRRFRVIGNAWLHNRDEVARWAGAPEPLPRATDLEVIAKAIEVRGTQCLSGILGDFALVVWNPFSRELVAARDAFGVKGLYYTQCPDLLALSSRAAVLTERDEYDPDYATEYLFGTSPTSSRTAFAGVNSVPSGSVLSRHGSAVRVSRYWSPADFAVNPSLNAGEQIEIFRELFVQAVTKGVSGTNDVWAQLSGGLDSSSIVSTAEWLALTGTTSAIAGTLTVVDSLGSGDETEYSNAVLDQHRLENTRIVNEGMWSDDGLDPPLSDQPYPAYPFFARDRRMRDIVRAEGGRVLLSGEGADHYLTGSLHFVADWIADRRVWEALQELSHWSATLKTSFWRLAFQYGLRPLLPLSARRPLRSGHRIPDWVLLPRSATAWLAGREAVASGGCRYADHIARLLGTLQPAVDNAVIGESLEVRYPFLYRPLVERALSLPPAMRSRPHARKWILREAMRGILPELVRTRTSKGSITGRFVWSLRHERERIDVMLRDPVLGQIGLIDPNKLRAAVAAVRDGHEARRGPVAAALSLETWLQVRSGQWTTREQVQYPQYPVSNPAHMLAARNT
jgi:asparagine synthase (glutamine-hydrolysing)